VTGEGAVGLMPGVGAIGGVPATFFATSPKKSEKRVDPLPTPARESHEPAL